MRARHQEILVADFRRAAIGTAAMNRAVLADDVVVSDVDPRLSLRRERNILRRRANDCAVPDEIAVPITTSPSITTCDCTVVFSPITACGPIDRKRADPHIGSDLRIRIDNRSGMNSWRCSCLRRDCE